MSTTTTAKAQEFDAAHLSLMSIAYGIALTVASGTQPTVRTLERFTAAQARYDDIVQHVEAAL